MTVTEARRLELAAQQPMLLTGGRSDRTGCYVLLAEFWRSQADMCQATATHRVCVDDYRSGLTTGGEFFPAETRTSVCGEHEEQVRHAPGFRWSRPIEATLPRAALVDIDGTLALRGDRSPYDWHRVGEDQPNPAVIELVRLIAAAGRHRIILMSGRNEVCRQQTEMWLDAQGVPFDELHMRPAKDNRKDSETKAELYRTHVEGRYEVAFVIDDRNQVVRMWRDELGLTVFQCADGDF